ncbi:ATP-dependent DNA helicase Rep [Saccharospirillum sp. MSK14-1]|uniref:DNA helicase Rep n=1 Tax=Saccharospirillum sp. MSK14-1 TaxID=1897632 RepID=UPI000D3C1740|nr:DNA helicase Rep [Saccharospirillum sp. MSK14-1]PTY37610.1 ATP-dependent DNA helicase Rep [Saccharospirillum sp. MSK14-1]
MAQLNPRQSESVHYISGPMLVLAGAGSGKTSVITQKIAYLINECGYKAHNIAAVTFTNKAAREMKSRVSKLVKGKAGHGLIVSTFHTLGLNILRRDGSHLGLKPGFTLFDDHDTKALIKDIVLREVPNAVDDVDFFRHMISLWKNDLAEPDDLRGKMEDARHSLAVEIYDQYLRMLSAYNATDFDDLIRLPTVLFRDHPEVLARWNRRIRYLLVDEYQDTNISQYQLVKMLVGDQPRFTVVGDDDQSIYSWRGARPENLVQLQDDFPGLKIVKLEQNYRSTGLILKAANTVIDNNPHVFTKTLWSEMGFGDPIRIIRTPNDEAEAERIANEILHQHLVRRGQYKDFAVLYRGNFQARVLEIKLQQNRIPYKMTGGTSFFAKAEIKDVMSYLRLLVNPDDDAAFLRIINTPRREIGPATLEKLNEYAGQRGVSLSAACQEMGLHEHLPAKAGERLERFSTWLDRTIKKLHTEDDPVMVIRELITDINYEAWLRQDSDTDRQAEKRLANVHILIDSLQAMLERGDEDDDSDIQVQDAIGKLVLRDIMDRQEEEDDTDAVQLMTLHASKGLEFPHVFVMGLEEELLPHRNSIESGDIEEERRLMYVGITRAQRTLTLTYAAKRKQFGEVVDCTPSRFLDELPPDDLQWDGREDADPAATREQGSRSIANLRAMLNS